MNASNQTLWICNCTKNKYILIYICSFSVSHGFESVDFLNTHTYIYIYKERERDWQSQIYPEDLLGET